MDLSPQIRQYIIEQRDKKIEKLDKEQQKARQALEAAAGDLAELAQTQREKRQAALDDYKPATWLDDAARRAGQVSFVTHAARFSHSSNRASSINATDLAKTPLPHWLGSQSLGALGLDVVGNAAALDVANLLQLSQDGVSLVEQIAAKDTTSLQPFAQGAEQLQRWLEGFLVAVKTAELKSHTWAKQTYFPVSATEYHLVSPIYPSCLAGELYRQVQAIRFDETATQARKQRKAEKGSPVDVRVLMNMAKMAHGGANQQNVSLGNARRGGRAYLLSSAPPRWQSSFRIANDRSDAFWRLYEQRVRGQVRELCQYLGRVTEQNNKAIRDGRAKRVSGLIDELLQLAAEARSHAPPGWSMQTQLPLHEQCFLDPERRDLALEDDHFFQDAMDTSSWRDEIAEAFARWLNRQLAGIKDQQGNTLRDLGDAEAGLWRQELNHLLSALRNDLGAWT